jgi:hypothetical protein
LRQEDELDLETASRHRSMQGAATATAKQRPPRTLPTILSLSHFPCSSHRPVPTPPLPPPHHLLPTSLRSCSALDWRALVDFGTRRWTGRSPSRSLDLPRSATTSSGAGHLPWESRFGQTFGLTVVLCSLLPSSPLRSNEHRNFKLEKVTPYNHNTSSFTFTLPEGTSSGLTVASALVVKSATEGEALGKNGKPAIKPYTPVTAPDVEGKLVRRVAWLSPLWREGGS